MLILLISILLDLPEIKSIDSCKKRQLEQIMVIKMPPGLTFVAAIDSENDFDTEEVLKDTLYLAKPDFEITLGNRMQDYSYIDIRTKVVMKYSDSSEKKYFLDEFGHVMWKDKIYEGSREQLMFLRNETQTR